MTDKHPTDALPMLEMPAPMYRTHPLNRPDAFSESQMEEYARTYAIAAYNLGRESMREEAAKEGDHWYKINKNHKCGDYIAAAIRSIEL
jgi:hypothetical protein